MATLVADVSVLVDGQIHSVATRPERARVLILRSTIAALAAQASRGEERGFAGLDHINQLRGECTVETVEGEEPRRVAAGKAAVLVTSDVAMAHAARAEGVHVEFLGSTGDVTSLRLHALLAPDIMSLHLKDGCPPMAKRGRPGAVKYEQIGEPLVQMELRQIAMECIGFATGDASSFVESTRSGCTVLQVRNMRITIARPPFADALEITAVRPIMAASLSDYSLAPDVLARIESAAGVFIAGPPGSGKSTFAAAVAKHLDGLGRVVKTMESPRDLVVPRHVTQYAPLGDMATTGEVMLLLRPDHVVFDEVRTTEHFRTFADLRLAGIGLIGVTHATRAIDAVGRLTSRVELGMIPQVVDTVVSIVDGEVRETLELQAAVRVPSGLMQDDLARPVVVVRDMLTGKETHELYMFGDQLVIMSTQKSGPSGRIQDELRRFVRGPLELEARGRETVVRVDANEVASVIGKGGRTVRSLEEKLGVRLSIEPLPEAGPARVPGGPEPTIRQRIGKPLRSARTPPRIPVKRAPRARLEIERKGTNVFIIAEMTPGDGYEVMVEGQPVGQATASAEGRLRFKAMSTEGKALAEAVQGGTPISLRRMDTPAV